MTDDEALARFEALMRSQQPPSEPWSPVTDFSFVARQSVEGKHPELIWQHLIGYDDADVLDYGCGPDGHLVRLLREYQMAHQPQSQVCLTGYDPQADESNPYLRRTEPRRDRYDLVVCREVVEHCPIREVVRIVRKLCALSSRLVYLTTRHPKHPEHFLSVDTSDDLDPDHRTMLAQPFLRLLFVLEGFKRRADLEAILDWKQLGRVLIYERG